MDPQVCWNELMAIHADKADDCIRIDDREEELWEALLEWLGKGGYPPIHSGVHPERFMPQFHCADFSAVCFPWNGSVVIHHVRPGVKACKVYYLR